MRLRIRSLFLAFLALLILTILPLLASGYIPREFYLALKTMSGFDLPGLLTKIEILGMTMSAMILMRSVFEKETAWGFGVSIVYKLYWLVVLFFILGLGSVENLGVAVIGGSTSNTSNIVMFDFRLISFLATIIVSLMIAHSFIEFREKSSQNMNP